MFSNVYFAYNLGSTPARVNRVTGELYLNANTWNDISREERLFILLHELGHLQLKTTSEHEADTFAFIKYADNGNSLKASINTLLNNLSFNNPEHKTRYDNLVQLAAEYDSEINNNDKPLKALNKMFGQNNIEILDRDTRGNIKRLRADITRLQKYGNACNCISQLNNSDLYSNFCVPFDRGCQRRKEEAKRQEEESKRAEAESRARAAEAAAAQAAAQAAATGSVSNAVIRTEQTNESQNKNKLYLILGGVGIVAAVIIAIVFIRKK